MSYTPVETRFTLATPTWLSTLIVGVPPVGERFTDAETRRTVLVSEIGTNNKERFVLFDRV